MPIAIIGMSCKFPGDATGPEALWRLCEEGRSAWSEIPSDRFNKDAFYHPSGDRATTVSCFHGSMSSYQLKTVCRRMLLAGTFLGRTLVFSMPLSSI